MGTGTGTYGGRTAQERRDERRARLVEAATDIWGEQGWAAVTMRGVCARAGLVDRYFYESFADRDALLVAAWEQARDEIVALVLTAAAGAPADPLAQLRAAIASVVGHIDRVPERARIVLGEAVGCAPLLHARREALQMFTDLLVRLARPFLLDPRENGLRMTALLAVGGFVELVTAWKDGLVDTTADVLVRHVTGVATALVAGHLRPPT